MFWTMCPRLLFKKKMMQDNWLRKSLWKFREGGKYAVIIRHKSCTTLCLHGLQHARFLCPPLSPGVCSNSQVHATIKIMLLSQKVVGMLIKVLYSRSLKLTKLGLKMTNMSILHPCIERTNGNPCLFVAGETTNIVRKCNQYPQKGNT